MNMKKIILAFLLISSTAFAQKSLQLVKEDSQFTQLNADTMDPSVVYFQYSEDPSPFKVWRTAHPDEYAYLALYDDYIEPTLQRRKSKKAAEMPITMFVAKAKMIINKPSSSIPLQEMITLPFLRQLDPEVLHAQIDPSQVMSIMGGQEKIDNFKSLCNKNGEENIMRPSRELKLTHLNRPGQPWCSDRSRSICVESCYLFNEYYSTAVASFNLFADEYDKKDPGMATQSEIRYFVSEAEMGKKNIPITDLTGIKSAVRGVFEQNVFYFNQMVQYSKILAVFQDHPKDASKTIVSSYLVFGIQTSTYLKKYSVLGVTVETKEILMGRGGIFNTATGITAGLPIYTQNIAKALSKTLEK